MSGKQALTAALLCGGWAACTAATPPVHLDSAGTRDRAARIATVRPYFRPQVPLADAEYLIDVHDNSGGCVPGPSDWTLTLALRVAPGDARALAIGYQAQLPSAPLDGEAGRALAQVTAMLRDRDWPALHGTPRVFGGARSARAVYEEEGVVLVYDGVR